MFIVYVTSGSYSYFHNLYVLIGSIDPSTIINPYITEKSGGRWTDYNERPTALPMPSRGDNEGWKAYQEADKRIEDLRNELPDLLLKNGFTKAEPTEIWLGD